MTTTKKESKMTRSTEQENKEKAPKSIKEVLMDTTPVIMQVKKYLKIGEKQQSQHAKVKYN